HLIEALVQLGASCVVLDDLSGGDRSNLSGFDASVRFIEGSILDEETVADAVAGCEYIFHQAALGSVPRSVAEPVRFIQVNVLGTMRVLEAARAAGVRRIMFAASSSAYGDSQVLPKVETMPTRPRSPSAASKCADEAMLLAWAASYGLDTVSLR